MEKFDGIVPEYPTDKLISRNVFYSKLLPFVMNQKMVQFYMSCLRKLLAKLNLNLKCITSKWCEHVNDVIKDDCYYYYSTGSYRKNGYNK